MVVVVEVLPVPLVVEAPGLLVQLVVEVPAAAELVPEVPAVPLAVEEPVVSVAAPAMPLVLAGAAILLVVLQILTEVRSPFFRRKTSLFIVCIYSRQSV